MGYPYPYPPGGGLYQPPPPPHPNYDPNLTFGSLNVSDPRYAAKYGNPYLRADMVGSSPSPQVAPRHYPYATMGSRGYAAQQQGPPSPNMQGYSSVQRSKKSNPVNYSGTMVGNGKAAVSSAPSNGKVTNGGSGSNSQYIVSPETDVKADAMATHV